MEQILNSDETKLIHFLFFFYFFTYHETDYWHLLFRVTFSHRIVEEEKNKFMFKYMTKS